MTERKLPEPGEKTAVFDPFHEVEIRGIVIEVIECTDQFSYRPINQPAHVVRFASLFDEWRVLRGPSDALFDIFPEDYVE